MKNYLIHICGATGIGKTALSISLAQAFSTEILSCDSRQFFKEMSIGTAAPDSQELASAPHHFIQHISIQKPYSVGDFEKDALQLTTKLFKSKNVLIMVGGSGLYAEALINGLDYFPEVNPDIREQLNLDLEEFGLARLQKELKQLDPISFETIDIHNPHRIIRALEICRGTGKSFSSFKNQEKEKREFEIIRVGLEAPREIIYQRINQRVNQMVENGLLDEVQSLLPFKDLNALQTVGYQELFPYLEGKVSLEDALEEIKKNSRRYAKRQITWNKRIENIHWFSYDTKHAIIINFLKEILQNDKG